MPDADRLTVTLMIVTAVSVIAATLLGVLVGEWLAGRRRMLATIQQVRRHLGVFCLSYSISESFRFPRDDSGLVKAEAAREAESALNEIEVLVPELPERVRGLVESVIPVLYERHYWPFSERAQGLADVGIVVSHIRQTLDDALRLPLESSLLRWWFFRRRGEAKPSTVVQGYLDLLPVLRADRAEKERQFEERQRQYAENAAKRQAGDSAAAGS